MIVWSYEDRSALNFQLVLNNIMKTIQNDAEMFGFKPNISAYIGVLTRDDANQLVLKDLFNHIMHFKGPNSTYGYWNALYAPSHDG